jgi:hypothetical protein
MQLWIQVAPVPDATLRCRSIQSGLYGLLDEPTLCNILASIDGALFPAAFAPALTEQDLVYMRSKAYVLILDAIPSA